MIDKNVAQLKRLLRFWTILFGGGALIFLTAPEWVYTSMDSLAIYVPFIRTLPQGVNHLWLTLSVSLMVTITFLSWMASKDVLASKTLISALLISKAVSTLCFCYFYFAGDFSVTMFLSALCDGWIFVITFYFYRKVFKT